MARLKNKKQAGKTDHRVFLSPLIPYLSWDGFGGNCWLNRDLYTHRYSTSSCLQSTFKTYSVYRRDESKFFIYHI